MASGAVEDQVGALQDAPGRRFAFLSVLPESGEPGGNTVAEVLVQFGELISDEEGRLYIARAIGEEMPNDTRWQAWIEFVPEDGRAPIASDRETTQPNRTDL